MNSRKAERHIFLSFLLFTIVTCIESPAQSGTSSAISGTVLDASGAALSGAAITATEVDTKAVRTVQTNQDGRFLFSQVNPGTYTVSVRAPGFAEQVSQPVTVEVSRTVALNFNLAVSSASQTVEVTAQQTLLTLENPNTTTTIESRTISNLPDAGSDLTFIAQFAPGALMNTAGSSNDSKAPGGYGNVEFNGLPATSNGYILDGYDSNDPWLGLNIGLSTNLVIGLDAVDQATVNTNSYSVDQGRYGASQVNYFTKSGTNKLHGDAYEQWDGSLFSAEDYFLHANDTPGNITPKPRSNVNHFGFSVGGPIRKDKLFFFTAYEGVRIALPIVVTQVVVPSPAYQQYVLSQLPIGGVDPITGTNLPAEPAEVPFYKSMFGLYGNTAGTAVQVSSCPLDASGAVIMGAGSSGNLFNGAGCANQRQESLQNGDHENLEVFKIDQTIDANNTLWYRFQQDTGLQAAWTDPVNVIFNSYSPQPQRTLVVGYTHIFRPNLVNQFNPGASWYGSIFAPNNFAQSLKTFPIILAAGSNQAPFTTIGGLNNIYPQGRNVTQWQVNDNLDWIRGKQEYRFGINTRRVDVSDYDLGVGSVPAAIYNDLAEFTYGAAYTESQTFPISFKERVAVGNLDLYAMDTYKPTPQATFIVGVRATWNTDPVNQQRLFARPAGSFLNLSHSLSQPFNQAIQTQLRELFPSTPVLVWQPRVSIAYQVTPQTVIHVGFGVFNDIIPTQIADLAATNAPYAPTFVGGIGGQVGGIAIAPGVANSAADAASAANHQFQSLFSAGGPPCAGIAPGAPTCPLAVNLTTFPTGTLKTPYYYQYNLGIEQKLSAHGAVRIGYVGTRGLHEPFQVGLNGYQTVCPGCFAPYPYAQPLDQRFGSVNEFRTDASSNYSGLQASLSEQFHSLTLNANYTLSHCLDEVSNGGLLPFSTQGILTPLPGELKSQYSNCDYDVRHNLSAYGIYQIPFASKHLLLRALFRNWSFSETAFLHSGLPFSVLSQPYTANDNGVFQSNGPQYARCVAGQPLYQKTPVSGVTVAGTRQWLNPNAFVSVVNPTTGDCTGVPSGAPDTPAQCQFGNSGRNTVRGPHFTDSDIYLSRRFPIWEQISMRFDVQMFNAFNHPNFVLPNNVQAGVPGTYIPPKFGTLEGAISPPTGLLGVGLGGDSSPRMIAFQARIEF
jgi:hypothetical protein